MTNHENRLNEQVNQDSESSINAKDFLIGALIGGIVGAATALFLTPKSGKEIRSDLNAQAHSLKDKTDHLRETAMLKGSEFVEAAKEKTSTISQTVSKQSNEILNKVKELKSANAPEGEEQMGDSELDSASTSNNEDVQQKLEETKKAFDETETLLNQ